MRRSFLHHNWSRAPFGDYESMCDICGVACPRSKLRKKADGLLYCPDDADGRDAVTLSRLNSRPLPTRRFPPIEGGFDSRDYGVAAVTQGIFDATYDGSFE